MRSISRGRERTSRLVAALQIFHARFEYGDEVLREMLYRNPVNCMNLLNSLCHLSNASLKAAEADASPGGASVSVGSGC